MSSRKRYIISYDVIDPKRLYRTRKIVRSYAIAGQKSFYECWLTETEFKEFQYKLRRVIENQEDYLFIFQLTQHTTPLLFGKATLPIFNAPFLIV